MKFNILCTNCEKIFVIDTDFEIKDFCPFCGHTGDIKFRKHHSWEDEEPPKPGSLKTRKK